MVINGSKWSVELVALLLVVVILTFKFYSPVEIHWQEQINTPPFFEEYEPSESLSYTPPIRENSSYYTATTTSDLSHLDPSSLPKTKPTNSGDQFGMPLS